MRANIVNVSGGKDSTATLGRTCNRCREWKPASEFHAERRRKDGLQRACKVCQQENMREARRRRKLAGVESYSQLTHRRLRFQALTCYSKTDEPECDCCGESTIEFLGIDHIEGGGRQHRDAITGNFYWWLKRSGYPDGFRVLCHNCNLAIGAYGRCPHQEASP